MFKDYVVVDNFFEDPYAVVEKFQLVTYYSKEKEPIAGIKIKPNDNNSPTGEWQGFRSQFIHEIDPELFSTISFNINKTVFQTEEFIWNAQTYFHLSPQTISKDSNWWHKDPFLLAGVIYLNPNPDPETGTVLKLDNNLINIENKFNRLVFYQGGILHRPNKLFGVDFKTVRKTITIFVEKICFG